MAQVVILHFSSEVLS